MKSAVICLSEHLLPDPLLSVFVIVEDPETGVDELDVDEPEVT